MPTPAYKGTGQPLAVSGWLGGLGSWFGGGSTPAYAGAGQPAPSASGYLGGSTPGYKPAPTTPSPSTAATLAPATSQTTDSQPYASDHLYPSDQPYYGWSDRDRDPAGSDGSVATSGNAAAVTSSTH